MVAVGTLNKVIEDPTNDSNFLPTGIFAGTVTGGAACTITATAGANTFGTLAIAYGTLNNLSSTTPTATGSSYFNNVGNPFTCGVTLTVNSGGFGIAGGFEHNVSSVTWTSSNTTIDSQTSAGFYAIAVSHTTSTMTSPGPSFAGFNFGQVPVVVRVVAMSPSQVRLKSLN